MVSCKALPCGEAGLLAQREMRNAPVEKTVDPFYAEYRRKRRLRRGSLSGNPETDDPALGQDEVDISMSGGSMTVRRCSLHLHLALALPPDSPRAGFNA